MKRLSRCVRPNRIWKVHHPDGSVETNSYDLADRLLSKAGLDKDGHLLVSYAYTYDDADRKLTQTEDHGQGAGNEVTTYTYDNAGRLASETLKDAAGNQISSHAYTYDSAGNRLTEITRDASNATTSSKTYIYNELEQLASMSDSVTGTSVQYAYDNNGNQPRKAVTKDAKTTTTEFTYTTRDQLRFIAVDGATKEDLLYDDLGRRIKKNAELEHWDGRSLIAETDFASGGLLRGYTHGLTLLRENVLGNMVEAYTDGMGSVGALVPQNGNASSAGHFRYDAYGNFRTEAHPGDCKDDPSGLTCNAPLTYTGHLYDPESNLFYFGARYYDPETGRFLTNDPVAGDALNPPSLHRYMYAYDSPMTYTDPWGEYVPKEDDNPTSGVWHPDFSKDEDRNRALGYFERGFSEGGVYCYEFKSNRDAVKDLIAQGKSGRWNESGIEKLRNYYNNYFGPGYNTSPQNRYGYSYITNRDSYYQAIVDAASSTPSKYTFDKLDPGWQGRWNRELLAQMSTGTADRPVMKTEGNFGIFDKLEAHTKEAIRAVLELTLADDSNGQPGIGHDQYRAVVDNYPVNIGEKANDVIFDYASDVAAKGARLYAENETGRLLFALTGVAGGAGRRLLGEWSWLKRTQATGSMTFKEFVETLEKYGIDAKDVRVRPGTNGKLAVIGRNMATRVTPVAEGMGAETFATWREAMPDRMARWTEATREWTGLERRYGASIPREEVTKSLSFRMNQEWVGHLNREGYTVLSTGVGDAKGPSFHYEMEVADVFNK